MAIVVRPLIAKEYSNYNFCHNKSSINKNRKQRRNDADTKSKEARNDASHITLSRLFWDLNVNERKRHEWDNLEPNFDDSIYVLYIYRSDAK